MLFFFFFNIYIYLVPKQNKTKISIISFCAVLLRVLLSCKGFFFFLVKTDKLPGIPLHSFRPLVVNLLSEYLL